ncbi:hypothetical protein [Paenibacillus ihbetae]|uniref:hypothetical protein n=1 Tax=Paenibacillus ihbetae TaxID=1870820 RepID=UPI001672BF6C|nr:hypothetical protein [Paenibacillus ihbetae]
MEMDKDNIAKEQPLYINNSKLGTRIEYHCRIGNTLKRETAVELTESYESIETIRNE